MATTKNTPKDAQVMSAILKDMGVTDYEPRVINQMMEFSYRYVTEILDDAKSYSAHASKKNVDVDDIKLAIQCKLDHSFTNPPPRELLMDVARHKNNIPLPLIKPFSGPKLPPDRYCLTASNFKLKVGKKPRPPLAIGSGSRVMLTTSYGGSDKLLMGSSVASRGTVVTTVRPSVRSSTGASGPVVRILPGVSGTPSSGLSVSSMPVTSNAKRKRDDDDGDDDYDVS